jgi:inosine/xanthosine triphosphatase
MIEVIWAVGTTNKAKMACVSDTVVKVFPSHRHSVLPANVSSAVSAQPMSASETKAGAHHRAAEALRLVPEAQFGVGLEGGIEKIDGDYFECGWMCVIERSSGRTGWGSSARFQMSMKLMRPIMEDGMELAQVMDKLTGEHDVRSNLGAMGVLTGGYLGRAEAYSHGLMFALAPFLSDQDKYWDN